MSYNKNPKIKLSISTIKMRKVLRHEKVNYNHQNQDKETEIEDSQTNGSQNRSIST